jgi:predicted ArsR family transcriptional regulator
MQISPELTRFILTSVPSIPFLEAALLLRRNAPVPWSTMQVAQALYVGPAQAEQLLGELEAAGVICAQDAGRDRWRFEPADDAIAKAYDDLDGLYRAEMVAVTRLIHDATQRSAVRFANAFKFRKES